MSLLIKALDNAEQNKQAEIASTADVIADADMSLEEEAGLNISPMAVKKYTKTKPEKNTASEQSNTLKGDLEEAPTTVEPKAAAKVFIANQAAKTSNSKYALVLSGVAGALIIWLGMQGYSYIKTLLVSDVVVVKPAMPLSPVTAVTAPQDELVTLPQDMPAATNAGVAVTEEVVAASGDPDTSNQTAEKSTAVGANEVAPGVEERPLSNMLITENVPPQTARNRKTKNNDGATLAEDESPLKREPVQLTSKVTSSGVDPTLLAAYQAFSRSEYTLAQQQYWQVLQRDVRNIDALLGMVAIAQRQGRDADVAGWLQKVLEIEPRNAIAQSAMMNTQTSTDIVGTESRVKSMLTQQPEGANLHAALGNLYAAQNRWALAQEAYFDASRFAPDNADYVFNLAISLDQLGKSSLALKQYQRALDLLNLSGASSPDRIQLETRIRALQ